MTFQPSLNVFIKSMSEMSMNINAKEFLGDMDNKSEICK